MQKITTFFWFDDQAEEAVRFYTSLFPKSRIGETSYYGDSTSGVPGSVMTINFELDGQEFIALNGGPHFQFTEAISLFVKCDSQEEVDMYWEKLSDGGEEGPCGWLKDRYGLSWQIVPTVLSQLLSHPDSEKAEKVTKAMLQMKKLDIAALQQAAK